MADLNNRQKAILKFLINNIEKHGYPPTIREICDSLSISSTSTAHKDIATLVKLGYLKKDPSKPRALVVKRDADGNSINGSNVSKADFNISSEKDIAMLPLVGRIAAGTPILASENIEDNIPVPSMFAGKGSNFMLQVHGESMKEVGIMDGDYLIVEEANSANNGEIVVAIVDGFESEATVKTFYKEDDHIRLQPENSSMKPIIVDNVKIAGKVKGVFRSIN
ncbi:MAG: transcriptional repressor LexA [Clostridia bacterium]|nr:transcriptional repressor LexA [Clostridia bacterium]